jgi:putative transposase
MFKGGAKGTPSCVFLCTVARENADHSMQGKPESYAWLDQGAREVNHVWNFANATSYESLSSYTRKSLPPVDPKKKKAKATYAGACGVAKETGSLCEPVEETVKKEKPYAQKRWLSAFDLSLLVAGCGDTFDRIGSDVAQKVTAEFVNRRSQFKKAKLRFRASGGAKRALGWIPFKAVNIRQKGNSLTFLGKRIRLFNAEYYTHHRKGAIKVCEGSFSQTALGDWYLNQVMEVAFAPLPAFSPASKVGMDPGKDIALSTGEKLVYGFYREKEVKIFQLQKRAHKKQCKYVHKKIANQRLNQQHQDTTRLIREHGEIYIGDNSVARMKQKQGPIAMGKSISDNAIGQFKTLLHYKGHWAGRKVVLVSERYTSQACSNCGLRTGPRGLRELVVRNWVCEACEASHDRDVNAAMNMLHSPLSSKNTSFQPRSGLPFAGTR